MRWYNKCIIGVPEKMNRKMKYGTIWRIIAKTIPDKSSEITMCLKQLKQKQKQASVYERKPAEYLRQREIFKCNQREEMNHL